MFYSSLCVAGLIVIFRENIAPLFTGEPQIQELFMLGVCCYSFNFIPDSMQMTMQGVMKTLNKPTTAAKLAAFS